MKHNKQKKHKFCDLCESEHCDTALHRDVEKGMKDIREGRTYIMSCGLKRGKCEHGKEKPAICSRCHVKNCERWYSIGKKDAYKRIYLRLIKELHNEKIWNAPCPDYEKNCVNCQFWDVIKKVCHIG